MSENKLLGSCPRCGKNIWESDFMYIHEKLGKVYRCISCGAQVLREAIVPF